MRKVYRGQLGYYHNGEADDILGIADGQGEVHAPLAEVIQEDMANYGQYLTVRYFLSDRPMSRDALIEALMSTITGCVNAEYQMCYSEITGYLYTNEEVMVGGHDLLGELRQHVGEWLDLEIVYQRATREVTHEIPPW